MKKWKKRLAAFGIAALCFGYFASYIPYSMMTKMVTKGLFTGINGEGLGGFAILPLSVFGSFFMMFVFLGFSGWWRYCDRFRFLGLDWPKPRWTTFISGICTAGVIATTTLAYSFDGISIVFAMLLMRGGVLLIAPVVDLLAVRRKRKIYWPSWVAAALSFGALLAAFNSKSSAAMTLLASVNILCYLLSYFLRLFIMSNFAKSRDVGEKKRYFAEEQMVANPVLLLALFLAALGGAFGPAEGMSAQLWEGFVRLPFEGHFWIVLWIGIFSGGTGLFGSLIFLDRRENTFTVPANRASSILAGVVATYLLALFFGQSAPGNSQLTGVSLILAAIFFLAYRQVIEKRKRCRTQAPAVAIAEEPA